jgi:hypothetical protein
MRAVRSWLKASSLGAAASLLIVLPLPPAGRSGYCEYTAAGYASPGFSMTPAQGVSRYEGTISCQGEVSRHWVRPDKGTIRIVFYYGDEGVSTFRGGDDCLFSAGHGTIDVTLPTEKGKFTVQGTLETVGALSGEVHGQLGSSLFAGVMELTPDSDHPEETCVASNLQHSVAYGQIALSGLLPR